MYDFDRSVGIFLTAKEHGLKLLGDEEKKGKKKKKVCSVDGCSSKANCKGQLCQTHGGKPCSVDGCTTKAKARGLCGNHGAFGGLREGCTTAGVRKGRLLCTKHMVKLSCADPDCNTPQIPGKFVCKKHGAYGYCTTDACINSAIGMRGSARNTTARQWRALWKAAALSRVHGGFVKNMAPIWDLLVQQVHHCSPRQRPVRQARRWQQESVQGGRLHLSC